MTIATTEEILTAVERWSRAAKIRIGDYPAPDRRWEITMVEPGKVGIAQRDGKGGLVAESVQVDPATALAFCLALDSGLTVDVGRCPLCAGKGRLTFDAPHDADLSKLLYREGVQGWTRDYDAGNWTRPCPDCNATGRDTREAVRLVLDAVPSRTTLHDSPERALAIAARRLAREALTARADTLIDPLPGPRQRSVHDARDPAHAQLGEWLALWLAGREEWTKPVVEALTAVWERLTVPCALCNGKGRRYVTDTQGPLAGLIGEIDCEGCGGHGRVKPHPKNPGTVEVAPALSVVVFATDGRVDVGAPAFLGEDGRVMAGRSSARSIQIGTVSQVISNSTAAVRLSIDVPLDVARGTMHAGDWFRALRRAERDVDARPAAARAREQDLPGGVAAATSHLLAGFVASARRS